jgi:hypothetical protein
MQETGYRSNALFAMLRDCGFQGRLREGGLHYFFQALEQ